MIIAEGLFLFLNGTLMPWNSTNFDLHHKVEKLSILAKVNLLLFKLVF
jgi:hypothetical protein